MDRTDNIVFIGPPGTGKTGPAIGLLRKALVSGHRGRFYNAQDLLDEIYASMADRTTPKLLGLLARYDLFLIDELGYLTLKPEQANAFFKLMDRRYGRRSTIFSRLPVPFQSLSPFLENSTRITPMHRNRCAWGGSVLMSVEDHKFIN